MITASWRFMGQIKEPARGCSALPIFDKPIFDKPIPLSTLEGIHHMTDKQVTTRIRINRMFPALMSPTHGVNLIKEVLLVGLSTILTVSLLILALLYL
jgi:hypothetical protein